MESKHICHLFIAQMGLVTGTLFTLYTVYIYATSAWRLLQVYNAYKGEHKVFYFYLITKSRLKETQSILLITIIPFFVIILLEKWAIG